MKLYNSHKSGVKKKGGLGFVNKLINKLPFELHIPSYNFCGPGTKLNKRLARGDRGINQLDEACRQHDIAYSQYKDLADRHKADTLLAERALERFKAKDSSLGEKVSALGVAGAMKAKVKLGMGNQRGQRRGRRQRQRRKQISFSKALKLARASVKAQNPSDFSSAVNIAKQSIKKGVTKRPRIIPIPKTGGVLPLIPIFAGLSALGALAGGASGIANAVNKAKAAQQTLKESERHNKTMEAIAMGKGLYLKPYKKGLGLYLTPPHKKKI